MECQHNITNDYTNNLTFGENYNRQTIIPNSVTHLTFGEKYNQPTIIPNSITHLTFGHFYNQQTIISNYVIEHNLRKELVIKEHIIEKLEAKDIILYI